MKCVKGSVMSKLAEKIAKEIMTITEGERDIIVARVQLMRRGEDGIERDAGGHCFDSVVRAVDKVLQE